MAVEKTMHQFIRPGRAGQSDIWLRAPELRPLADKCVAVFGLGCVGAPSVLELARAGVGELRLLDHDIVDPGTVLRWPLGLGIAGRKKTDVLRDFLREHYPYTKVSVTDRRIGGLRREVLPEGSDEDVLHRMMDGASLVYDATAEQGVQHVLSHWARESGLPYLAVDGTFGGWGGRVVRIDPGRTEGCWLCFEHAYADGTMPPAPAREQDATVQPRGCGDPTFTGAGFDLAAVALHGVRVAVATLCAGKDGGYPAYEWDVTILGFRDGPDVLIAPRADGHQLKKHPTCPLCGTT